MCIIFNKSVAHSIVPENGVLVTIDHRAVGIKRQLGPNSSPPHRHSKIETKIARGHTYDLREDLDSRAGYTRSIYGSRGCPSTRDDGYLFGRDKPSYARADNRRQIPSELRRDAARYRGAAHPLCFIDEVMDHEFPEGFKPVNIESYDGTTDPAVWIEDFILHIHMARGDDLLLSNTSH